MFCKLLELEPHRHLLLLFFLVIIIYVPLYLVSSLQCVPFRRVLKK